MPRNQKMYVLLQYTAAIATSMSAVGFVCAYSWPSPSLPYLSGKNSEIPITRDQGSWIASLYPLGLIVGYLLNPFFIDRIGRKWTLMIFIVPQITSWLLIVLAKNCMNLYVARFIAGIGYGGGHSSSTVYISEIGDLENRGIFLVLMKFMMNLGFLFTMLLGAFLSYKNMNLVLLMMPVTCFVVFLFLPDSSYFWKINQKKEKEALDRLNSLKHEEERDRFILERKEEFEKGNLGVSNVNSVNNSEYSKLESNSRISNCGTSNFENHINGTSNSEFSKFEERNDDQEKKSVTWKFNFRKTTPWKLFTFPNYRRGLIIPLVMGFTNIFSGHAGITTFTQQIFTYEGSFLPPEKAAVVLATMTVIFSLLSTQIVEKVKRKILLLITSIMASISLALVGIFFFLKAKNINVEYFEWFPVFGITTYDIMLSCGMGNLFFIYQGELYANEIKSAAISFNKISYTSFNFFFLLQFQNFVSSVEIYVAFWVFTTGIIFGTFFLYILTPETRGKTISEIQILLNSGKLFFEL